jgi:pimeloyl-ACP methyl ester carboxylesterase
LSGSGQPALRRERVSLDGVATAFLDAGVGDAVVALHGVPTSSALFEPLLPHLRGYRLLAPDIIGQGDTATPATGPLDYLACKAHVDSFLAIVPPRELHLIVHDLGGIIGLEWAADHPQRVRSVVILSTTVTWSLRVGVILAANLLFGRALLRAAMPATLKGTTQLAPSLVERWTAPWTRRRLLRGMDLFAARHLARLRFKLHNIRVPVLLIWGEDDDIFPLSSARQIAELIPQARLATIPRCGHWSPLDATEEVARYVVEFLDSTRVRR